MDFAIQKTKKEWRLRKGAKGTGQRVGTWSKDRDPNEVLHQMQDLATMLTPSSDIAMIQNYWIMET